MREIPKLHDLCLRAVGSHSCSAEDTFAAGKDGEPSIASRFLRSLEQRSEIPIARNPCIGPGSSRRINANDVDLNHPFIGCRASKDGPLIAEYGNPALDCLQQYLDALVELGRMDDQRVGIHFFKEWKANVCGEGLTTNRKRRRGSSSPVPTSALGSLSLHNCVIGEETVAAMVKSGMCEHLAVLDMTGVRGCSDEFAADILEKSPNLVRLSFKNCRKITDKTLSNVAHFSKKLQCLDIGGCFNLTTAKVLEIVPDLPEINELHASGLLWKDSSVRELVEIRDTWKSLSLGFSGDLTQSALRESLIQLGDSLESLALPFCENVVDNALLGMLGRNLPKLQFLDLRGNPSLSTLTGWYDGRASADLPSQPLTVLARYSSLSESSVEETRRVHPVATSENRLTVYLDSGGMGAGIVREAI